MARTAFAGTGASWKRVAIRSALSRGDCVTREKPPLAATGEGHDNTISKPGHARSRGRAVAGRRTRLGLSHLLAALALAALAPGGFAQESHHVALFPAAAGERQGFVRVINQLGGHPGVRRQRSPASAASRCSWRPAKLSTSTPTTLRTANATKGLAPGVGAPAVGDWALGAFLNARHRRRWPICAHGADGFLTSARDVAPAADGVPSNRDFQSGQQHQAGKPVARRQPSDDAAVVVVRGVDDDGTQGQPVTMTVPAGAARVYTAKALEDGHCRFSRRPWPGQRQMALDRDIDRAGAG